VNGDPAPYPQDIPRPADARPGGPAPWDHLDADRRHLRVADVVTALGAHGQRGAPPPAPVGGPGSDGLVPAAVLVALFTEGGGARVVLTRRAAELRAHRGQVSFPGGRIEPGEGVVEASLREAAEEVSLDPASVRPVGWLNPVTTLVSSSLILPVVAVADRRPLLAAHAGEVARVFDVGLADLLADGVFAEERWRVEGRDVPGSPDGSFPVWFFTVAGETVWGATARMLMELVTLSLGLR
jgi:8-oxo-dGTP pyrophosphatase MutT (NUDIX family)